jgi:hypothetical protein
VPAYVCRKLSRKHAGRDRVPELRKIQRLAVELDVACELRRQRLAQTPIDDGQPRKVLILVEQEQDLTPLPTGPDSRLGCVMQSPKEAEGDVQEMVRSTHRPSARSLREPEGTCQ